MKRTLNLSVGVFITHTEFREICSNSLSIQEMIIIIIIIIMMMMMMMMMMITFAFGGKL